MLFKIQREILLSPLTQICGVVEKKHTMPVLGNVLIKTDGECLLLTASDLDVEMRSECVADISEHGEITVPAQKLLDICKALPDGSIISFKLIDGKCELLSGKSKFSLITLAGKDFPLIDDIESYETVSVESKDLQRMLKQTVFCMAIKDVRYFLNGLLFEVLNNKMRCVAADGHRLALSECDFQNEKEIDKKVLIPRKGVLELQKMIRDIDQAIVIYIGRNHLKVEINETSMTTKLIDGKFPDYETVIPLDMETNFTADKDQLRKALQRVAILSNEQFKGVKFKIFQNQLELIGHNPDHEQAEEIIQIEADMENTDIAFNVGYLLDATNVLEGEKIQFCFKEVQASCLIKQPGQLNCRLVIMPLKL